MPDNLLPPIARPGAYETRHDANVAGAAGTERAALNHAPASAAERAAQPQAKPAPPAEQAAASAPQPMANVRLHFKVDPQTHEVTVVLVDTASKKVVRTIPAEELQKLKEGDLVELLA